MPGRRSSLNLRHGIVGKSQLANEGTKYRYWKFTGMSATTAFNLISEVQLRVTPNLAVSMSPISTGSVFSTSAGSAAGALDGDIATYWQGATGASQFYLITFNDPAGFHIRQVMLSVPSGSALRDRSVRNFTLSGSNDNSTYTPLLVVSGSAAWAVNETRVYDIPDY